MEEHVHSDKSAKAYCFLYKEGDEKNQCILNEESLSIIYHSRKYLFEIEQIHKITFETRKLMFPLILGAITAAFVIISIINNLFNPWISLSILMISSFVLYIGWSGTNVLTIQEKGIQNDFMLKHVSINMKSFVKYVNKNLKKKRGLILPGELLIYHITPRQQWLTAQKEGIYIHDSINKEGFIHASDYDQVLSTAHLYYEDQQPVLLAIDPEKLQSEVKYELSSLRHMLFPHIFGPINLNAVVDVKPLLKDNSGNFIFPSLDIP